MVGFSGIVNVVNAGVQQETGLNLDGDLVVTTSEPIGASLSALDGVSTVSEESRLPVWVASAEAPTYFEIDGIAIDPVAYLQTHRLEGVVGNLGTLAGDSVAVEASYAAAHRFGVGDTVETRIGDDARDALVVATFPYSLSGPKVLLPLALAPEGSQRQYIVQIDNGASRDVIAERIVSTIPGAAAGAALTVSVSTLDDWVLRANEFQEQLIQKVSLAVLGLVTVYIVIAMVNAVVISAAPRRSEFAIARLTGLSRRQVVATALWESLTVVTVGIIVGVVAAGSSIVGVTLGVSEIVGTRVVDVPWALLAVVILGVAAIVGLTSVVTTLVATRQPAVVLAAARE